MDVQTEADQRNEDYVQSNRKVHIKSCALRRYLKMEKDIADHPLFLIRKQLKVSIQFVAHFCRIHLTTVNGALSAVNLLARFLENFSLHISFISHIPQL